MTAMRRRLLLLALAGWPAVALHAQDPAPRPQHKISAARLHEALSARFPLRLGVPGLFELHVSAPSLLLLPTRQRIGATLRAQLSGGRLANAEEGELDVIFALRYEGSDQTIRAHRMELLDMRWRGLPPESVDLLRRMLSREAMGEIVLHRLTPRELAVADALGLEPDELRVVEDGIIVVFGPRQRR